MTGVCNSSKLEDAKYSLAKCDNFVPHVVRIYRGFWEEILNATRADISAAKISDPSTRC